MTSERYQESADKPEPTKCQGARVHEPMQVLWECTDRDAHTELAGARSRRKRKDAKEAGAGQEECEAGKRAQETREQTLLPEWSGECRLQTAWV
jgi:hypothetical protein